MFLGDFHIHSQFSDGELTIPEIIDLYGANGVGAIAITDHLCEESSFLGKAAHFLNKSLRRQNFTEYMDILQDEAERAWRVYKMLVIPGVEITKNSFSHNNSAHILALDIREFINPDETLREIIQSIHRQGGLAIAAHPVFTGKNEHQTHLLWNQKESLEPLIDAWEVASGKTLFSEVQKSSLKKLANSDLHKARQFESWKNLFSCEKSIPAIKDAIYKQQVDFKYIEDRTRISIKTTVLRGIARSQTLAR